MWQTKRTSLPRFNLDASGRREIQSSLKSSRIVRERLGGIAGASPRIDREHGCSWPRGRRLRRSIARSARRLVGFNRLPPNSRFPVCFLFFAFAASRRLKNLHPLLLPACQACRSPMLRGRRPLPAAPVSWSQARRPHSYGAPADACTGRESRYSSRASPSRIFTTVNMPPPAHFYRCPTRAPLPESVGSVFRPGAAHLHVAHRHAGRAHRPHKPSAGALRNALARSSWARR